MLTCIVQYVDMCCNLEHASQLKNTYQNTRECMSNLLFELGKGAVC